MSLPSFTKDVKNIQALGDRPNAIDGLTAQELKAKFDKAGEDIKDYINDDLIPAIESDTTSRKCNNTFDNSLTARENLGIKYGTSLPSTGTNGDLFFLYVN